MTIIASSPLRNRLYVRQFDHEEARERWLAGETIAALAREYGVTYTAVWRVVDPDRKRRVVENHRVWRTGSCEICGGPAMRLVGSKAEHNPDGRTLCKRCRDDERTERFQFLLGRLIAVRCGNLDCANGERWQPPENFNRGPRHKRVREGGVHSVCRACNTRNRQQYRELKKVPCRVCGSPCLPADEKGTRGADTGMCRSCWLESRRRP